MSLEEGPLRPRRGGQAGPTYHPPSTASAPLPPTLHEGTAASFSPRGLAISLSDPLPGAGSSSPTYACHPPYLRGMCSSDTPDVSQFDTSVAARGRTVEQRPGCLTPAPGPGPGVPAQSDTSTRATLRLGSSGRGELGQARKGWQGQKALFLTGTLGPASQRRTQALVAEKPPPSVRPPREPRPDEHGLEWKPGWYPSVQFRKAHRQPSPPARAPAPALSRLRPVQPP
ncbi:uncharacterized protein [Globicephala melas]|uniref:uncharacterized protein n=1 Tax=Globicephala melas TaxID=9731 RepID=UPI00122EAEBC|nr:protein piccolo-like [Globicephala melas]